MNRFVLSLALFLFQGGFSLALDIPKLQGRITDVAGILTPDQVATLDSELRNLEVTDSTQIAVLIIPSLEGESLEDYTIRVVEAWKLGQKGKDNGVLLFISLKDRKIAIEAGYGLEHVLGDADSSQIIRNEIAPRFRSGDFYGGIDAGITGIIQKVRGVYSGSPNAGTQRSGRKSGGLFNLLIVFLFPLLWILSITGKWGGGALGAGAGMLLPYTLFGAGLPMALGGGVVGGILGIFMGALVRGAAKASGGSGRGGSGGPFFWGGGGSGLGGGGFSGGGGFGGGFSGGGGSFGGGGSSGSW